MTVIEPSTPDILPLIKVPELFNVNVPEPEICLNTPQSIDPLTFKLRFCPMVKSLLNRILEPSLICQLIFELAIEPDECVKLFETPPKFILDTALFDFSVPPLTIKLPDRLIVPAPDELARSKVEVPEMVKLPVILTVQVADPDVNQKLLVPEIVKLPPIFTVKLGVLAVNACRIVPVPVEFMDKFP